MQHHLCVARDLREWHEEVLDDADAPWPSTRPSLTVATSPFRMWRSVPQMVVVTIRTTASVGCRTTGWAFSSHAFLPGPW